MADDAMDWRLTTPPALHNPYRLPQYMPGGWPAPTPSLTYTTGVFLRKRKLNPLRRVVKRVCLSLQRAGALIAYPIKPTYIIVREFRARRRERSRRRSSTAQPQVSEISSAQGIDHPAVSVVLQPEPERPLHILTPPSTPPRAATVYTYLCDNNISAPLDEFPAYRDPETDTDTSCGGRITDTDTDTDIVSSGSNTDAAANTKTSCEVFDVPKSHVINSPCVTAARAGIKRRRSQDFDPEHFFVAIQGQLTSNDPEKILYVHSSMADAQRPAKRSKGSFNPFSAADPWGTVYKIPMMPVRAPAEPQDDNQNLVTPWAIAKPITATALPSPAPSRSPSPSLQLQDELTTYSSRQDDEDEPSGEVGSVKSHTPLDRSWSSISILSRFRRGVESKNPAETIKPGLNDRADTPSSGSGIEGRRLFHVHEPTATPPPVRNRFLSGVHTLDPHSNEKPRTPVSCGNENGKPKLSGPADGVGKDFNTPKAQSAHSVGDAAPKKEEDALIIDGDHNDQLDTTAHLVSTIPAKTTTTTNQPQSMPTAKTAAVGFETPSGKFAKLSIHDGDNDTPKATRHSGTKSVRVTRYREAQEKALKSKLEEYELVPITAEWDKKVRDAVRTGIPDYLGPHDLARVTPQYARRGQDNWLNDETINKYLDIVAAHGRKNDRPDQIRTHHAFSNFFYNNLKTKGPESVLRWSKRAKIGGKSLAKVEKVFVPINSGAHWTLAVVEPMQKKIIHYNSMRGTQTGIRVCEDLKAWVAAELGRDFDESEWQTEAVGSSPQQTNSDDCGVFTITSARQIMLGLTPMSYSSSQIPLQRIRIVAELINRGLLKSTEQQ